jgi:hypothetical protein
MFGGKPTLDGILGNIRLKLKPHSPIANGVLTGLNLYMIELLRVETAIAINQKISISV